MASPDLAHQDHEIPDAGPEIMDYASQEAAPSSLLSVGGLGRAISLLLPHGEMTTPALPPGWRSAAHWIVPLGLLTGLAWTGVFKLSWRVYGETASLRIIPALAIVLLECLLTGPFLMLGFARTMQRLATAIPRVESEDATAPLGPVGTLLLCLEVLSLWVLVASVPTISPWWPAADDWRYHLRFLYPAPVYRPLLLAPLWGRWGILLAATIGRTAPRADQAITIFCSAMRPTRLLLHSILPLSLTSIYLSRDGNLLIGVVLGMVVFVSTYLLCVVMAIHGRGQTRQTLYAAGGFAQLAFLAIYRAFWPLIHG